MSRYLAQSTILPIAMANNKRLNALDIDGVINLIDTNIELYQLTTSVYLKDVKIYVCNRSAVNVAKIRVAHIDGSLGSLSNADYLLYEDVLLPGETKILELDGMVENDTIMVRSDSIDVNFEACAAEYAQDVYNKRVGAIDIDGTINVVDTDYAVYTSTRSTKANMVVCNRNATPVEVQIAHVNSNNIGDISDEDRKYFTLDSRQSLFLELDLNMASAEIISFRSDTANVNAVVYIAE